MTTKYIINFTQTTVLHLVQTCTKGTRLCLRYSHEYELHCIVQLPCLLYLSPHLYSLFSSAEQIITIPFICGLDHINKKIKLK